MLGSKATLRSHFLAARPDSSQGSELSARLSQHLLVFLEQQLAPGQTILIYWPYRQEPDLSHLLQLDRYHWGLPRCLPDRQLAWHHWHWGDPLATNRYGIEEPLPIAPLIKPSTASILIIPAIAIDHQGYRLGYGGGYFDRLLSSPLGAHLLTIGVVFDHAYVSSLPIDPWDIPLQYACTESGIQVPK